MPPVGENKMASRPMTYLEISSLRGLYADLSTQVYFPLPYSYKLANFLLSNESTQYPPYNPRGRKICFTTYWSKRSPDNFSRKDPLRFKFKLQYS